jgi:hypothetical protein
LNITKENIHLLKVGMCVKGKNFPEDSPYSNWNTLIGKIIEIDSSSKINLFCFCVEFFPIKKEQNGRGHNCGKLLKNKNGYNFFSRSSANGTDSIFDNLEFFSYLLNMFELLGL